MTNVINLDPPTGEDAIVRVVNHFGCDELNVEGKSYRPNSRHAYYVPRRCVTRELLTVGGFVEQPLPLAESIQDVASAIHLMPPSVAKTKLSQALADLCEPGDDT